MIMREPPIGVGHGEQRFVAGTAGRRLKNTSPRLGDAAKGEPAHDAAEPVDMLVERRRPHADAFGDARQRDRGKAFIVGDRGRGIDHRGFVQSHPRHVSPSVPDAR